MNSLSLVGMVLDAENRVIRASNGIAIYGLIEDYALRKPELVDLVIAARQSAAAIAAEVTFLGRNGEELDMLARAASLSNQHVVLLLDDRTEAKRVDAVRRDFVANVSHELKTPIGAIDLLTRSIRRNVDDPQKVVSYASDLAQQAERLAMLVHDIIALSEVQASKNIGIEESISITPAISEAIDRNRVLAQTKGVNVLADLSSEHLVYGDQEQLATAIRNLIENAINYSDEGQTVGVGIKTEGDWCTVSVKDEGAGISPENQKRVFERFYRVDPSRSRHTGGTGLGLSIVKHIAENHHGRVELASIPGKGSTFSILIPSANTNQSLEGSQL